MGVELNFIYSLFCYHSVDKHKRKNLSQFFVVRQEKSKEMGNLFSFVKNIEVLFE